VLRAFSRKVATTPKATTGRSISRAHSLKRDHPLCVKGRLWTPLRVVPYGMRWLLSMFFIVLLLIAGCGGKESATTSTEMTTALTSASTTTSTAASSSEASMLKRRDAPTAGVAAQANFFTGSGGGCYELESYAGPPSIKLYPSARVEVPTDTEFCFPGFSTDAKLKAQLTYPDGRVARPSTGLIGLNILGFYLLSLPGDPIGRHTINVHQGPKKASLAFEVVQATRPRLLLVTRNPSLGGDVHIALGGFNAGQPARLHLYRRKSGADQQDPFQYQTSFDVPTDRTGAANYFLRTAFDDPPACYGIQHNEQISIGEAFCLGSQRPGGEPGTTLVILASKRTEQEARAVVAKLRTQTELRRLNMVVEQSSAYRLLEPGFWIVHTGQLDREFAEQQVRDIRPSVPGAYVKQAAPS
jgi:hypothetical protein